MDKALYIGTSGANNSMHQLEILTNNLANINTVGFRGDYELMKQYDVSSNGQKIRSYSMIDKTYSDFKPGPIIRTGRDLDVALSESGFITVQAQSGKEGYTRAGDLQIKNGFLTTQSGHLVKGDSGLINVGNAEHVTIGTDGTVSIRTAGEHKLINVGRIKLVNPSLKDLQKGTDGLFYASNGSDVKYDPKLKLTTGALEGSNVNPVETLTNLIELSREFEMHSNLMKTMSEDASKSNQILSLSR